MYCKYSLVHCLFPAKKYSVQVSNILFAPLKHTLYHFMWTTTWNVTFWEQVLAGCLCLRQKADSTKKQVFCTLLYVNMNVNYAQQKSSLRTSARWDILESAALSVSIHRKKWLICAQTLVRCDLTFCNVNSGSMITKFCLANWAHNFTFLSFLCLQNVNVCHLCTGSVSGRIVYLLVSISVESWSRDQF
jgi:hypothetical protein